MVSCSPLLSLGPLYARSPAVVVGAAVVVVGAAVVVVGAAVVVVGAAVVVVGAAVVVVGAATQQSSSAFSRVCLDKDASVVTQELACHLTRHSQPCVVSPLLSHVVQGHLHASLPAGDGVNWTDAQ